VKITPMFGRWGYFVGPRLFACFPVREKDRDLWICLTVEDQARALRDPRVRPHRRFARRGWVELIIDDPAQMELALRWLRRAWSAVTRSPEEAD
jgi:predicted DNA-binding protein (MmcQ/YjbR family)